MMYGYGPGAWWMMLMPVLWIALIGVVVWAVVRLVRPQDGPSSGGPSHQPRETPREILDRRYAQGDIDDEAYTRARTRLAGQDKDAP